MLANSEDTDQMPRSAQVIYKNGALGLYGLKHIVECVRTCSQNDEKSTCLLN